MAEATLQDCHVLVVEDEFLLAYELETELTDAGATVVATASTVDAALQQIDCQERIDGAVLDVNLGGKSVYPVADRLVERNVPFVFTTGYDASALPSRFKHVMKCEKPIERPVTGSAAMSRRFSMRSM